MNVEEFAYIAKHLTPQECRRLFSALHFTSYDLPTAVFVGEKSVPRDVTCINLLLRWNDGLEIWEGKDKTHVEVAHRLQQLGRRDLANWLSRTVFHKLTKDMCDALDNFLNEENEKTNKKRLYDDKYNLFSDEWTDLDYILWFLLIGLVFTALFIFGNIIVITYKKRAMEENKEEMDLFSHLSMDCDEDSVYNYKCITTREDNFDRIKEEIH